MERSYSPTSQLLFLAHLFSLCCYPELQFSMTLTVHTASDITPLSCKVGRFSFTSYPHDTGFIFCFMSKNVGSLKDHYTFIINLIPLPWRATAGSVCLPLVTAYLTSHQRTVWSEAPCNPSFVQQISLPLGQRYILKINHFIKSKC